MFRHLKRSFSVAVDVKPSVRNPMYQKDMIWSSQVMDAHSGLKPTTQVLFGNQILHDAHKKRFISFSNRFQFPFQYVCTVRLEATCEKIVEESDPLYHTVPTLNNNPVFTMQCSATRIGLPNMSTSSFGVSAAHNFGKYLNKSDSSRGYEASDVRDPEKTFAEIGKYHVSGSSELERAVVIDKTLNEETGEDVALISLEESPVFMIRGDLPQNFDNVEYVHFIGYRHESATVDAASNEEITSRQLQEWYGPIGEKSLVGVSKELLNVMKEESNKVPNSSLQLYENFLDSRYRGLVQMYKTHGVRFAAPGLGGHSGSGGSLVLKDELTSSQDSKTVHFVYTGFDHPFSVASIIPSRYDDIMAKDAKGPINPNTKNIISQDANLRQLD